MSELDRLLKEAAAKFAAMPEAEKEAMIKAQRGGWVRGEMSWPEAKFRMVNGVKVYDNYEDYCND